MIVRPLQFGMLILASALYGCPVYSEGGCRANSDCAPGYSCDQLSGACYVPVKSCSRPEDCRVHETCNVDQRCVLGDCTFHNNQCVAGYVCSRYVPTTNQNRWQCIPEGEVGGAGGSAGGGGSAGRAGASGAVAAP